MKVQRWDESLQDHKYNTASLFYANSLYSNYTVKPQELNWVSLDADKSFWVKHWLQELQ